MTNFVQRYACPHYELGVSVAHARLRFFCTNCGGSVRPGGRYYFNELWGTVLRKDLD